MPLWEVIVKIDTGCVNVVINAKDETHAILLAGIKIGELTKFPGGFELISVRLYRNNQ